MPDILSEHAAYTSIILNPTDFIFSPVNRTFESTAETCQGVLIVVWTAWCSISSNGFRNSACLKYGTVATAFKDEKWKELWFNSQSIYLIAVLR